MKVGNMRCYGMTSAMYIIAVGVFALFFVGCGGSSGDSSSGDTPTEPVVAEQGVLIDSAVSGVDYETPTYSGVTDKDGKFKYLDGETVIFSIGNLVIGSATGKEYVTPLDLVPGATDVTDPTVTNICKLLQVLDEDGDPSNGINITDAIKDIVSGADLDLDSTTEDFGNDPAVQDLLDDLNNGDVFTDTAPRDLPSDQEAQDHLSDTLSEFPITCDYAYLQYRSYENGDHPLRGWISLYRNENSISESEITKIELKNANGELIPISGTSYWVDPASYGEWNSDTSMVDFSSLLDSGFSIGFDGSVTTLSPGNYTYEVTTNEGDLLKKTVYYPGDTNMPCVDDASMEYEWLQDGSLKLTWDAPTETTYDEIRVVLEDEDQDGEWGTLLYVKLPIGATEVTIPSSQLQKIEDLDDPYLVHWRVQTRSYTDDRNMYARGFSDTVSFPWEAGGSPILTIEYAYLQFRTYEDDNHAIRGWAGFRKNGKPIYESDITKIELKNANGDVIPNNGISFWMDSSYSGSWNSNTSNVDYGDPYVDSGFSISFNDISTLPSGDYTYEATTIYGDIITLTISYPGDTNMPCVDDASMEYEWLQDGSLKLTWDAPTETTYDEIRVVFDDQDELGSWGSLLYIKLPVGADEVIIPSTQIQKIEDLDDPVLVHWVVQTRSYTDDRNMYARGYSDTISFLWNAREASLAITGESGGEVDLDGIWRTQCLTHDDPNESSAEATAITGSSFTTKEYSWYDIPHCFGPHDIEVVSGGTVTLGSEVIIGSVFGDVTTTKVDLTYHTMTATVYDPDMISELNTDQTCGYSNWEIGVAKNLLGTDCAATEKDIIYIDDTGDDEYWYAGCDEDECTPDAQGYPTELMDEHEKYRFF